MRIPADAVLPGPASPQALARAAALSLSAVLESLWDVSLAPEMGCDGVPGKRKKL